MVQKSTDSLPVATAAQSPSGHQLTVRRRVWTAERVVNHALRERWRTVRRAAEKEQYPVYVPLGGKGAEEGADGTGPE